MPFYYDVNRALTSNGSGNTESEHFRLQTIANQETFRLCSLYGAARFGTAGGAQIRLKTWTTIGSGGTSQTPGKRNPNNPAATTTVFNDATALTPGTGTATTRVTVGMAQTGGMGGWVALEPSHALALLANGGGTGNAEVYSICNGTSVTFDCTMEFAEGA